MTVPTIAAVVLATLAAALAFIAWRQRRAFLRLQNEAVAARPEAPGDDAARAMLAALREPALLYGERIEAVNEPFAALVGVPAGELAGKTLADLVSVEYAELARRSQSGACSPATRSRCSPRSRSRMPTARSRGSSSPVPPSSRQAAGASCSPPRKCCRTTTTRQCGLAARAFPARARLARRGHPDDRRARRHRLPEPVRGGAHRHAPRGGGRPGVRRDDRLRRRERPSRASRIPCSSASPPATA